MTPRWLRRLVRLRAPERRLLAVALVLTPITGLALRLLGLERAARLLARLPIRCPPSGVASERAGALVDGAASGLAARCLTKALVLHTILNRCGRRSALLVGAAVVDGRFRAHAWVQGDEGILIGAGCLTYTPLWRFAAGEPM